MSMHTMDLSESQSTEQILNKPWTQLTGQLDGVLGNTSTLGKEMQGLRVGMAIAEKKVQWVDMIVMHEGGSPPPILYNGGIDQVIG